jgi:uncharacterized protein (TIGR03435 family)
MDRFDVIAKVPADSTPETQQQMLQSLLEDRFGLKVHKDTKPLPTYALVVGKKPLLKETDGKGETGCKLQSGPAGPPGEGRFLIGINGATIMLGPGATLQYQCRNMTMAAFAEGLGGMMGANVGPNKVLDQTGLEGRWNFDVRWSLQFMGPMMGNSGDRVTVFDAVEKQLGLKLEQRQIPTPVIVVDGVNETPSANPPGVAEALPEIPVPTEFEVADVKPSGPGRMGGFRLQPGGRVTATGVPMRLILMRAFNTIMLGGSDVVGILGWADTERFEITAKAPAADPAAPAPDVFSIAPMLRSLLSERFGLKYHTEEKPSTAYSLVAARPRLKKADPASRTWCKQIPASPGTPPGTQVLSCQNATLTEFAERLQGFSPELNSPVMDATGVEGRWDLTLSFMQNFGGMMGGPGRGGDGGLPGGDLAAASDPTGGITIFQAIEKQLGLKLEMQKRSLPVIVIDRLEQKPTDN